MKKLLMTALILTTLAASAQDFRMGVKGTFYSTWLFNTNIADQLEAVDYAATFSPSFGISAALFFTENLAASIDVLYASNNQKLEPADASMGIKSTTRLKYLDLPLLLKISSEGGAYVELGPQFSILLGANEDLTQSPSGYSYTKKDVKNDFNTLNMAPVLGFGVDVQANDNLFINIGLRFGYGINDVTKKFTQSEITTPEKHSYFSTLAHTDAANGLYNYQKTFRAFGGITLGVIYRLN